MKILNKKIASLIIGAVMIPVLCWGGINFDGVDDYVNVGVGTSIILTGNLTISAWVNPKDTDPVVSKRRQVGSPLGQTAYGFINAGTSFFHRNSLNLTDSITGTGTPTLNVWSHVAVTISGTTVTLYKNGATNGGGTLVNTREDVVQPVVIGRQNSDVTGVEYTGQLCEVAIWNVALTPEEILRLANTKIKGMPLQIQKANLKAYWPIDEGPIGSSADGDTIKDWSGNAFNGVGVDGTSVPAGLTFSVSNPSGLVTVNE